MTETTMAEKVRQLNIRDNEIHRLANDLAERMGVSTKDAVRQALEAYDPKPQTAAGDRLRARRLAQLDALTRRMIEATSAGETTEPGAVAIDNAGRGPGLSW